MLLLAALLHVASFDILRQPILTDIGYYLHFARRVAAGAVPYVDFIDYKTPLSMFVGAALVRTGQLVGLDPVLAVRVGYLALVALAFLLGARLAQWARGGRLSAAWLTLAAFAGFELLGRLPSIGNVPKAIVFVAGLACLLAIRRGRFALAGACVVLAGLDWQPGGFLAVITLGAALLAMQRRGGALVRATLRATLGATAAAAPFALFFALRGGWRAAWEQCVAVPFSKSAAAEGVWSESLPHRLERLVRKLGEQGTLELALSVLALAGLVLLVLRIRGASRDERGFRVALVTWHGGVLAWTLFDFQGMADLFLLEGSLAFLAGIALDAAYGRVETLVSGDSGKAIRSRVLPIATALVLVAVVRPSFLAGGMRWVGEPDGPTDYDLMDQREVAEKFARAFEGKKVACLTRHELLVLGEFDDAAGVVFWHYAVHDYRGRFGETSAATLIRLLESEGTEVVVLPDQYNRTRIAAEDEQNRVRTGLNRTRLSWLQDTMDWIREDFRRKRFSSEDGSYLVKAWQREES